MGLFTPRRRKILKRIAEEYNLDYWQTTPIDDLYNLTGSYLYKNHSEKKISHHLYYWDERMGADVSVFDLKGKFYRLEQTKQTVIYIRCKDLKAPKFLMKPKNLFQKFSKLFVDEDQEMDYAEYPSFDETYTVTTKNLADTNYFLKRELLELFSNELNWTMEVYGSQIVLYQRKKILPAKNIVEFMDKGLEILEIMMGSDSNDYV